MKQPKVPKQSWREEAFKRLLRFARNDEEGCHCQPKLRAERGDGVAISGNNTKNTRA